MEVELGDERNFINVGLEILFWEEGFTMVFHWLCWMRFLAWLNLIAPTNT